MAKSTAAETGTRETNLFLNETSGIYRAGAFVGLGSDGLFTNRGLVDVSGVGSTSRLYVKGNFDQEASGTLKVNVSSTPTGTDAKSDLLEVDGSLKLRGTVKTVVIETLRPENFQIAKASGSLDVQVAVSSLASGSPFTWSARTENGSLYVTPQANFVAPAGRVASISEQNLMQHLQKIWNSGAISQGAAMLFGDFARIMSPHDYMQAINSLTPEQSESAATSQTLDARASMHAALSCPVFEGSGTLMQENSCAWARIIGNRIKQTSSSEVAAYDQSSVTYRGGVQKELATNWFVGGTVGFTQSHLRDPDGSSTTRGNGVDAAISLKHQIGPWLLAASGHLGFGSYKTDRVLDIGPSISTTSGTASVLTAAARIRGSYELAFPTWYVKPYLDVDILHTYVPSYEERGLTTTLQFDTARQWNFAVSPNIELGARVDLSPEMWLRPYASAGMTFFARDRMPFNVGFKDLDQSIESFVTEAIIPARLVNLTAGAQLFSRRGFEIRAQYKADLGRYYLSQELSARLSVPF